MVPLLITKINTDESIPVLMFQFFRNIVYLWAPCTCPFVMNPIDLVHIYHKLFMFVSKACSKCSVVSSKGVKSQT